MLAVESVISEDNGQSPLISPPNFRVSSLETPGFSSHRKGTKDVTSASEENELGEEHKEELGGEREREDRGKEERVEEADESPVMLSKQTGEGSEVDTKNNLRKEQGNRRGEVA